MRWHNPLEHPRVPPYMTLAARFTVLIRTQHPCVATGEFNVRVATREDEPIQMLVRRVEASAHILRVDYEVQQVTPEYWYITLIRFPEEQNNG